MTLRPAPGTFAWLIAHEVRLGWRGRQTKRLALWLGVLMLLLWVMAGVAAAVAMAHMAIPADATAFAIVGVASLAAVTLMTTQAILASQQTLYGSGDLDLLLTAPVPPRLVLLAKLVGIAATVALTSFVLVLPIALPVALLGHPRLLGVVVLLVVLALLAASLGLALTLAIARVAGPRAARTVGQIAAALAGGAAFLVTQLGNGSAGHGGARRSAWVDAFEWIRAHGVGDAGWSSWPGRAAFGEPLPLAALLALGVALFAGVGWALQRAFLSGYQDAGVRLSRARPTGRAAGRLFHAGLFRTVFAKEWRLLARDPALVFQIVLRLIYMAPLALVAVRNRQDLPLAPALAFASVLIAGQLAGSFAWLAVSAEDAPELLAVAPVEVAQVNRIKLAAALAMAAPFAVVLPLVIVRASPLGALVALAMTALGGVGAGWVELKLGKPAPRTTFARRRQGSLAAGLLAFVVTGICGGIAGAATWWLGQAGF